MKKIRAIVPFYYKSFPTFPGVNWEFSDKICIKNIDAKDFEILIAEVDEEYFKSDLSDRSICLYIDDLTSENKQIEIKDTSSIIKYVLNNFLKNKYIKYPLAFTINDDDNLDEIIFLDTAYKIENTTKDKLEFKKSGDRETISHYFKYIKNSVNKNRSVIFTIERYNSAFLRIDYYDRIVDLTISLESLIDTQNEIKHKFALYISFIAEGNMHKRFEIYEILSKLYDVRSSIVHGTIHTKGNQNKLEAIKKEWPIIMKISKSAINYYLFFNSNFDHKNWNKHLINLIYDKENRIVS